ARVGGSTVPTVEVRLGTNTLIAAHAVTPAGGANPYHEVSSDVFTAGSATVDLTFVKGKVSGGDCTALIDNVAIVQVPSGTAPFVTRNPASVVVSVGDSTTFSGQAIGSLPLSFQWLKNSNPISGATNSTLLLSNIQKPGEGDYSLVISNAA